jgi:hypothetical protein
VKEKQRATTEIEEKLRQATSSAHQEKIVRDQLLLQKPGEYIVQIPPEKEKILPQQETRRPSPREAWTALFFSQNRLSF